MRSICRTAALSLAFVLAWVRAAALSLTVILARAGVLGQRLIRLVLNEQNAGVGGLNGGAIRFGRLSIQTN